MAINFKKSISDPIAGDIGNKTIQGMTVSKTIQLSLFTKNENAVWGAKQLLQKESYPFMYGSVPVNRNLFRLQVGDPFLLSFAKYGITNMVCRLLLIEEKNLNSEKIILHYMQDIFSISKAITEYSNPTDLAGVAPDYAAVAFTDQDVIEAPYVLSQEISVVPIARRETDQDLGMYIYMSMDDGSSYINLGQRGNIKPYGELSIEYGLTYPIDDIVGILIDFETDVANIDTTTWPETLSGSNMAMIDDEIISFQTITPISGTIYKLDNVIRGRYGTEQAIHSSGSKFWFIGTTIGIVNHQEILPGVSRKFKLVPYNLRTGGLIADATVIDLSITGVAETPYIPINFNANGVSFASRYTADIILTWDCRKRGGGAGVGVPGVVLANTDHEGLFDIEVWVNSVNVRTETDIDALIWTYTSAMNISDNGSLASEVEFRITNHRSEDGVTYTSNEVTVTTKL